MSDARVSFDLEEDSSCADQVYCVFIIFSRCSCLRRQCSPVLTFAACSPTRTYTASRSTTPTHSGRPSPRSSTSSDPSRKVRFRTMGSDGARSCIGNWATMCRQLMHLTVADDTHHVLSSRSGRRTALSARSGMLRTRPTFGDAAAALKATPRLVGHCHY